MSLPIELSNQSAGLRGHIRIILAAIGACALCALAVWLAMPLLRNQAADSVSELVAPDKRYALVVTETLAGFPGQVCIKEAYLVRNKRSLDRRDDASRVYSGSCAGLRFAKWDAHVLHVGIDVAAAAEGVAATKIRKPTVAGYTVALESAIQVVTAPP